jgi:hypothetical protein
MEVRGELHTPTALPLWKQPPVPIEQKAVWAAEPVRTLWNRGKSFVSAGNRTPAVQPETRPHTDWAIPAHNNSIKLNSLFIYVLNSIVNDQLQSQQEHKQQQ